MGVTGESWKCPHCGEQILRSAVICPACQRRLHVNAIVTPQSAPVTDSPLSVEGIIRHPGTEAAWEYSVLVEVQDQEGETLARRVVGVGALQPGESRIVRLRIDIHSREKLPPATAASRSPRVE